MSASHTSDFLAPFLPLPPEDGVRELTGIARRTDNESSYVRLDGEQLALF